MNEPRGVFEMSLARSLLPLLAVAAALLSGCGMPASCEAQSDCPQATVCALGVCRLECPCGDGEQCLEGACYSPRCDSGVTCAAGAVCIGDSCGDPACGGIDCGSQVCNPQTRTCVDCVSDAQCGDTSFTCDTTSSTCQCAVTELPEESCGDGEDNSCNRLTDCADPSCAGRACQGNGLCLAGACCQPAATEELSCSDGVDDDCDGKVDCADDDCLGQTCLAEGACNEAAVCLADQTCAVPVNKTQGTLCRPAGADVCNPAEYCTGQSPTCPEDRVAAAGTVCRPRRTEAALCDQVEVCDGESAECPVDALKPADTFCRASAGVCDVEDRCDGRTELCTDGRRPNTYLCKAADAAASCDLDDYCDGGTGCPRKVKPAGTLCRSGSQCNPEELCDGSFESCPVDAFTPAGTTCAADSNVCTQDQCDGKGACTAPSLPDGSACGGSSTTYCCGGQPTCIDFESDSNNCGRCGKVCTGLTECVSGQCCESCPDGSVRCGGASCN